MKKTIIILLILFTVSICNAQGSKKYVFSPSRSEYSMTFPSKPVLSEEKDYDDNQTLFRAFYDNESKQTIITAIIREMPQNTLSLESKKVVLKKLANDFIETQNWENVSIDFEDNYLGLIVTGNGYKYIAEKKVTYECKYIWGEHSILNILLAAPADVYPTNIINDFIDSIKR